jgi:hypothetical protein
VQNINSKNFFIYNKLTYIFLFILYLSLICGFIFNENFNTGSYRDWIGSYEPIIKSFSIKFKETLLSYESFGNRHSPIYLIFLSIFLDIGFSSDFVRLINLHLCLSLIYIFYKCLKLNFTDVEKKYLQLLSLVIFLSPTFRSLSIWPDSRLPGLVFFSLSIYFFLKFLKYNSSQNAWYCSITLILASYISPNFSIFAFYFYFFFLKKLKMRNLFLLFVFNLVSSLPAFYYLFILKVNFLIAGKTPGSEGDLISLSFNFSDKILIISSILLFHLFPIMLFKKFYNNYFFFLKKNFFGIVFFLIFLIYFFNYSTIFTGGGLFFQLSQLLFKSDYLFFGICIFSITLILYLSKLSINNFFIIFILIISNIQNTIYHKYYEPMFLIVFFTLFKNINLGFLFKNKKFFIYLYAFSFFYIFARILKNIYYT